MRKVTATEARKHFAELLRTVEGGETVAITRRGKVVARVVPAPDEAGSDKEQSESDMAVEQLLELRRGWAPTGMTREEILAARHEGHRF